MLSGELLFPIRLLLLFFPAQPVLAIPAPTIFPTPHAHLITFTIVQHAMVSSAPASVIALLLNKCKWVLLYYSPLYFFYLLLILFTILAFPAPALLSTNSTVFKAVAIELETMGVPAVTSFCSILFLFCLFIF